MSDGQRGLDSLFLAALEIQPPNARAAFLKEACGPDVELRTQVEQLLRSHERAGSFLEKPAPELAATLLPGLSDTDRAASLDAGLTAAFRADAAVVIGSANHSVLRSLGQAGDAPRVVLREPGEAAGAAGSDPIVQPKSAEMPDRKSDSRYRLDGEIARGGMGAILKGRDTDLGRDLAIKVLLDVHKDKPEVVQRFIEEAQIGGQLQHPGIAPVYELGQFSDRRPFFSMKLVKGLTLAKLLADRDAPTAERGRFLKIFEQVCQTMAYAHSRGVIHRDLKPANVMVGAFGEVQVMDWGLAKVLPAGGVADEKTAHRQHKKDVSIIHTMRSLGGGSPGTFGTVGSQTQMGSVMGTPAYMPPEQALGEIDNLDERADVFGLGAILCEVLTGQPPYVAEDGTQVFRLSSRGRLGDCFARLDACGADAELIALTKHCLQPEANDRPRNASALAERVSGYLLSVEAKLHETETARAVQTERLEQQQRASRKLRKMIAGLAVVAAITVATSLVAGRFWRVASVAKSKAERSELTARREAARAQEQRRLAETRLAQVQVAERAATKERVRADREAEGAQQNLYYAQMHLAQQAWREHRGLQHTRELLTGWVPEGESPERRGWEWFYLNSLPYQNVRTFRAGNSGLKSCTVAWHVDSKRLAEGTTDGLIRIWDADREQTTLTLTVPAPVTPWWGVRWLAWSPDGGRLCAGGNDGTVHVVDANTGRALRVLAGHRSPVWSVAFSSDGARVAAWGQDGTVKIWAADSGELTADVAHPGNVVAGAWSPDDKFLATGHGDGTVTVSGTKAGDKRATWRAHSDALYQLAWSPDNARLASTSSNDFFVNVWDVASQKVVVGPLRHSHGITALAWEPDGKRLASGSIDQTVKIWDGATGREAVTLRGYEDAVLSLSWGPNGRLASGGNDGALKVWNSIRDQEAGVLPGEVRATSVSWSPDGKQIASGADDGTIRIWDAATRRPVGTIEAHERTRSIPQFGLIRSLAWSPDGTHLASAAVDGTAKVWEVAGGRKVFALPADHGAVWSVAWSPDGTRLAAGSQDGVIRVVGGLPADAAIVSTFQAHDGALSGDGRTGVCSLAWGPRGIVLASGGFDGLLKTWDPLAGAEQVRAAEGGDWVTGIAWSPDGTRLASSSSGTLVTTWDAKTVAKLKTLRGHNDFADAVAWSPDGTRLASAGLDNSVRVWDAETGEETFVLRGHAGFFHDVAWHPDGTQLAAACSDGQVWIWDATRGFERDTSPRALPYLDRQVAAGTARGEDAAWYAVSYLRAGKPERALLALRDDPHELGKLAQKLDQQGNATLADEARRNARALLVKQLAAEPDNTTLASELANQLLAGSPAKWTFLRSTDLKSTGGATLTLQGDGSILATGVNAPGDVYTMSAVADVDRVAAVRLEAMPDPSLPHQGPGRHSSGNFHVSALRLQYAATDAQSAPTPLALAGGRASFDFKAADADVAGVVDESLNKVWHVWGRVGEAHHAVFSVKEPSPAARGRTIAIELRHRDFGEGANLGRFRLSVSAEPDVEGQRAAAAAKIRDPWARLAAAYQVAGDRQALDGLLARRPDAAGGIGDMYAIDQDWRRAVEEYSKLITDQTNDGRLLAKRAVGHMATEQWGPAHADWVRAVRQQPELALPAHEYYRMTERWAEASEFGLLLVEQDPKDSTCWTRVAPIVVLADDEAAYGKFCARVAALAGDAPTREAADRATKACLLRPGAIDLAKLPGDTLARLLDEQATPDWFSPWGWSTRALLAWRSGDAESAVTYAAKSEECQPGEHAHAINLAVLAIAHHRLQHPADAAAALEAALQLVTLMKQDASKRGHPDLLTAEILVREAQQTVNGQPDAKPAGDGKP